MSGGSALGSTYAAISRAKLEDDRFLVALVIGIVISVLCVWLVRVIGRKAIQSLPPSDWKLRVLYSFAFLWLILAGVAGFQLEKWILHLTLL